MERKELRIQDERKDVKKWGMKMKGISSLKTAVFCHNYFNNTVTLRHFSIDSISCITLLFNSAVSKVCGPGSIVGIATGYGLDGPGIKFRWGRNFPPIQTAPGTHTASCTMGTGSFPGIKSGRGVRLTPHPLLVPRSRKSRAIRLLPLWAVRPVLSACTRLHLTYLTILKCIPRTNS